MSEQVAGPLPARGPLDGVRVVEFGGMGPGPHGVGMLADLGADVVVLRRPGTAAGPGTDRGRRVVEVDVKSADGRARVLDLVRRADVLVEGFRPGVMERLRLGPEVCLDGNPALVYARVTGWGQEGPLAERAGHDINYIGVTGMLHAVGRAGQPPVPPLNVVGDYGGGSLYLVVGVLAALLERGVSGRGQVVDAAIVDGTASLTQTIWALRGAGRWSDERGVNRLDSGAPFYDVYETADGRYMAVGALEPQFYREFVTGLGLDPAELPEPQDREGWPELRKLFTSAFAGRTRAEWMAMFEGTDACVTPVLTFAEAAEYPHLTARRTLVEVDGVVGPAPAPRLSRSPGVTLRTGRGADVESVLADWS